jgi:exonuclease SbcD
LIHTADLHLGTTVYGEVDVSTGMSKRIDDYFNTLDFIIDYSIKNKADALLICGDVFKNANPTPTTIKMFATRLRRLTTNGIKVVMISGNHDLPKAEAKSSPLEIYSEVGMEDVYFIKEPTFIDISTRDKKKVRIFATSYIHPVRALIDVQNKKAKDITYEDVVNAYRELHQKCIESFCKSGRENADLCILMLHLGIFGVTKGAEETPLFLGGEFTLLPNSIQNDLFDYVAMGHIHKHQCCDGKVPAVYSGSIERCNFSEIDEKKGFVAIHYDSDLKWQFIEVEPRRMLKIEVDGTSLENVTDKVREEIEKTDIKDAIVKVVIKISTKKRPIINYDEIKMMLKDAFYSEIDCYRVDEERVIKEAVFSESLNPNEVFVRYLGQLASLSPNDRKIIEKLGLDIIKEVEEQVVE